MDQFNYKTSENNAWNMHTDILMDIYCWQQIILDRLASFGAEKQDCPKAEVIKIWEERKTEIRKDLIEKLFEKYGPDPSEELGL